MFPIIEVGSFCSLIPRQNVSTFYPSLYYGHSKENKSKLFKQKQVKHSSLHGQRHKQQAEKTIKVQNWEKFCLNLRQPVKAQRLE